MKKFITIAIVTLSITACSNNDGSHDTGVGPKDTSGTTQDLQASVSDTTPRPDTVGPGVSGSGSQPRLNQQPDTAGLYKGTDTTGYASKNKMADSTRRTKRKKQ